MPFQILDGPLWPQGTLDPGSSSSPSKRKRLRDLLDRRKWSANLPRQQVVPDMSAIAAAKEQCQVFSGNNVLSCYPNSSTTIYQDEWATFVWNSRLPQYAQREEVNIYLFHGDSGIQILNWSNYPNPTDAAGSLTALVNDSWWGDRGLNWNGSNVSFLFYWVITPNNQSLGNSYIPQATFTAVQTTYANSVLATLSPSSTSTGTTSGSSTVARGSSTNSVGSGSSNPSAATGSVQSAAGGSSLAHWAIAVIVVLGFLAILASCVLGFFIIRRLRRRRGADLSHRGSVGSSTPMMAESHANAVPSSPLLGAGGVFVREPSSSEHHDGASVISRANSAGDSALFSGADAAIMADAFRKALRKPGFAEGAMEEESPEEKERKEAELLSRELAEEGRDIRSVGSSRGVRVETLSDSGETVQDSAH